MRRAALTAAVGLAALAPPAAAAPRVRQMVVFRDGRTRLSQPSIGAATAKIGRRRCVVGAGTPLAALIHSGIGPLSIKDYGACSNRAADAGSLFVSAIGPDRNKGSDGWVYKAGNRLATAGAADPSGPFGRGRLEPGTHVTWFWCHVTRRDNGCAHTLSVAVAASGRTLTVRVRQWSDKGMGGPAAGATVHAGGHAAKTAANGVTRLRLPRGRYGVWAGQPGRIRSFPVAAEAR